MPAATEARIPPGWRDAYHSKWYVVTAGPLVAAEYDPADPATATPNQVVRRVLAEHRGWPSDADEDLVVWRGTAAVCLVRTTADGRHDVTWLDAREPRPRHKAKAVRSADGPSLFDPPDPARAGR